MRKFTQTLKRLAAFAFLACPLLAQANIGEDIGQLRARYGSAKALGNQMLFQVHFADDKLGRLPPSADPHDGYSISVYFDGAHSGMEIFTRNTTEVAKMEITQQDIDRILAAESDGLVWTAVQVHSGKPTWLRSDNKLIARFSSNAEGKAGDASALVFMLNSK